MSDFKLGIFNSIVDTCIYGYILRCPCLSVNTQIANNE